jgi:hypothetical protein
MEKTHDFEVKTKSHDKANANENVSSVAAKDHVSVQPPAFQLQANTTSVESEEKEEASTPESTYQLAAEGVAPPSDNLDSGSDDQSKPNNTGLPTQLKSGVENLSGFSLDDVKVHYNSDKPAQLQAHAYAQGTDIHVASGQEKHLPHEAWHVVQQKQGRVQPTTQLKAFNINDDAGLEKEADVMGAKAMQMKAMPEDDLSKNQPKFKAHPVSGNLAVQRVVIEDEAWITLSKKLGVKRSANLQNIDTKLTAYNARKNDPTLSQDAKEKLLIDVQEAINTWKFSKISKKTGEEKSKRLGPVFALEEMISAERATILGNIEGNINTSAIDNDYTHLSSYGVSSKIGYTGYEGQTEQDFQDTKQQMDAGGRNTSRLEVILQMLTDKVEEAKLHMLANPDPGGEKTLAVLTAPEWFFMKPGQPFSATDKQTIVTKVKALSASAPNMVIIPGSILWSGTNDADQKMLKNTAFSVMNGQLLHEVDKYAEGLDTKPYVARQQSEVDPTRTVADTEDAKRKNNQWTAGGGRVNEDRDEDQAQNQDQSSIFAVGALSFSVEICADHNSKRAKMEMESKNVDVATNGVHVQIIVSAGANPNESNRATKVGGIAISNDAATDSRGLFEDGLGKDDKTASSAGHDGNFHVGRAQLPA